MSDTQIWLESLDLFVGFGFGCTDADSDDSFRQKPSVINYSGGLIDLIVFI